MCSGGVKTLCYVFIVCRAVTFWLSLLLIANKLTYQLPNPLKHQIWQLSLCLRQYLLHNFLSGQVSLACCLHHWNTTSFLLLLPVRLMEDAIIPEVTVIVSRKLIYFDVLNYNFTNKDWHMTLLTLHITQMLNGLQDFFLSFVCIFFGKASLVLTCHLQQWDTIKYLLLQLLKVINQVSVQCQCLTVIANCTGHNSILF